MREVDEIIIHCSATKPEWMQGKGAAAKRDEIRHWHVEGNGWSDIGYHHLIDRDGVVIEGRPLDKIGAHTRGHNTGTIGVCLIGGHKASSTDAFADHFTQEQARALRQYIGDMKRRFPDIAKISGHNEYAAKGCPGFSVARWINNRPPRQSVAESTTMQAAAGTAVATATGAVTAIGGLSGTAQIIVIVAGVLALAGLAWIARERLRKWGAGDR